MEREDTEDRGGVESRRRKKNIRRWAQWSDLSEEVEAVRVALLQVTREGAQSRERSRRVVRVNPHGEIMSGRARSHPSPRQRTRRSRRRFVR